MGPVLDNSLISHLIYKSASQIKCKTNKNLQVLRPSDKCQKHAVQQKGKVNGIAGKLTLFTLTLKNRTKKSDQVER